MAERKPMNKYYAPDYDYTKVPKGSGNKDGTFHVRYMLPFKVMCLNCGEIMGAGKKFNNRIEKVQDRDYLGVHIHRIYFKCAHCSQEFALVTNPETADYDVEYGVKRMFNFSAELAAEERAAARRAEEAEENGGVSIDAMRALDARTEEVRNQVEMMDALEELQAVKATHAVLRPDDVLAATAASAARAAASAHSGADAELEAEAQAAFQQAAKRRAVEGAGGSTVRLATFTDAPAPPTLPPSVPPPPSAAPAKRATQAPAPSSTGTSLASRKPRFLVRRKGAPAAPSAPQPAPVPGSKRPRTEGGGGGNGVTAATPAPASGGLVSYSSGSSDSEA